MLTRHKRNAPLRHLTAHPVAKPGAGILLALALLAPTAAQAYIGPGVGAGVIGVVLGVIGSIFLAIFAVVYYPIKRAMKKRKKQQAAAGTDTPNPPS